MQTWRNGEGKTKNIIIIIGPIPTRGEKRIKKRREEEKVGYGGDRIDRKYPGKGRG